MINIAYIIDDLRIGGAERILVLTIKKLDKNKYRPRVYALFGGGPIADEIQRLQVPVDILNLSKLNAIPTFVKLIKSLSKNEIKIVHTFRVVSDIMGTIAAKITRVPVIISSRGSNPYYGKYIYKLMDRFASRLVTTMIVVSDTIRQNIFAHLLYTPNRVVTIYNGIELDRFNMKINIIKKKSQLGLEPNSLVIGTVANLNWRKDIFTLLAAGKLVLEEYPHAQFLLVGDGPQRDELQELAQQLGLSDNIHFLGSRQDITDILAILDIFVLSSVTEGLSVAILEAMAMGNPVVATNVGGIPEVVLDGETGFLVPPKAPAQLAQAIKRLISHKELAVQLGAAGKNRVEQYFSADQMIHDLERLYHNLYNPRKQQE